MVGQIMFANSLDSFFFLNLVTIMEFEYCYGKYDGWEFFIIISLYIFLNVIFECVHTDWNNKQ